MAHTSCPLWRCSGLGGSRACAQAPGDVHRQHRAAGLASPGRQQAEEWPRQKLTCRLLQVYEVVDNAIDEAQAGYATLVEVVLRADGAVSVRDNGRGVRRGQEGASPQPGGAQSAELGGADPGGRAFRDGEVGAGNGAHGTRRNPKTRAS